MATHILVTANNLTVVTFNRSPSVLLPADLATIANSIKDDGNRMLLANQGVSAGSIDALFLAPEATGRGGGRQLVSWARALRGDLTVDVNEQNPEAQRFYEKCGFIVTGRSDTDDQGRPYPLLHMRLTEADLYQQHAGHFDAARTRSLMEAPYLDRAAALAPSPARVLDLGCGAGEPIARYFIERGDAVTGVDVAPAMLALAQQRFPTHEWLHADMRHLALDRQFDVVVAWDSSFHLKKILCGLDQQAIDTAFQQSARLRLLQGGINHRQRQAGALGGGSEPGSELGGEGQRQALGCGHGGGNGVGDRIDPGSRT